MLWFPNIVQCSFFNYFYFIFSSMKKIFFPPNCVLLFPEGSFHSGFFLPEGSFHSGFFLPEGSFHSGFFLPEGSFCFKERRLSGFLPLSKFLFPFIHLSNYTYTIYLPFCL